jgi:hypothetical protein
MRFLAHLELFKIMKLCVEQYYNDMEDMLIVTLEVGHVLVELGEIP